MRDSPAAAMERIACEDNDKCGEFLVGIIWYMGGLGMHVPGGVP